MHVEWASIFISYVPVSFHLHRILNPGTLVRPTHITHRNPWKLHQLDGFRNFPTKKDTKSRYLMGKSHSFCGLHPLAITFCIGTKQSHNPRHMYSTAGITFRWNLLNLTLTCYTTVLGLHEALHKHTIWIYLAPDRKDSKDSKEHVQYQLLGRWKGTSNARFSACKLHQWERPWLKLYYTPGKGSCWSLQHQETTLLALPDSDTGRFRHVGMRCLAKETRILYNACIATALNAMPGRHMLLETC